MLIENTDVASVDTGLALQEKFKPEKIKIARNLMTQLHVTEESIDTALSMSAQLIETYIESRRAVKLSTVVGPSIHAHTLKAMTALANAQAHMSAAHAELKILQDDMGLSMLIGPVIDKPSERDKKQNG